MNGKNQENKNILIKRHLEDDFPLSAWAEAIKSCAIKTSSGERNFLSFYKKGKIKSSKV